jgi:DNA polymerase
MATATLENKQLDTLAGCIRVCVKCPLHTSRIRAVPGDGDVEARFMIIGEGPGKDEDRSGHPFVGSAGRYLDHVLEGSGIERSDFFITNIVKCRPPKNRAPKAVEILTCTTHYLFKQIELVDPKRIILLGSTAVKKMLGLKNVEEARQRVIESNGRKYMASYHPASRFYREDLGAKIKEDFAFIRKELEKC